MEIKCKFEEVFSRYTCIVRSAVITKRNTKISAFLGTHFKGNGGEDVKVLHFSDSPEVKYFPRGIAKLFPNLDKLVINHCGLKKITNRDLVGLQNLTKLRIQHNKLVSLPYDLLDGMNKLKEITLVDVKVEFSIDSKRFFGHLKSQLDYVYIHDSKTFIRFWIHQRYYKSFDSFMNLIDEKFVKSRQTDAEKANMVLKQLWDFRRFTDFTIKVDTKEIKVHRAVLGTQSSVFAAMFDIDLDEKKSCEMTISEFSSSSVEEFVEYFYTGLIPEARNAMEIFELAAKYDVESLKVKMEEEIVYNIEESNAIEVLLFGNLHKSEDIMSAAFEEVQSMYPDIEFEANLKFNPEYIKDFIEANPQRNQT